MSNKFNFKTLAALGKYPYIDKVNLFGQNPAVSTSYETIWQAGAVYAQLLAGVAMEVVSASANDTAAGTGARTIRVDYVSGSTFLPGYEVVILNGITPVPLVATNVIAINKVTVLTAGSGLTNAGNLDVRVIAGAAVKSRLPAGTGAYPRNISCDFKYYIPLGYIGLLSSVSFCGYTITGDLSVAINTHDTTGLETTIGIGQSSLSNTGFNDAKGIVDLGSGVLIPEKTHLEAKVVVSAGVGTVTAQAELLLFEVKGNGIF